MHHVKLPAIDRRTAGWVCVRTCVHFHAPKIIHMQHFIPVDFIIPGATAVKTRCNLAPPVTFSRQTAGVLRSHLRTTAFICAHAFHWCHSLLSFSLLTNVFFPCFPSHLCWRDACVQQYACSHWISMLCIIPLSLGHVLYNILLFVSLLFLNFSFLFSFQASSHRLWSFFLHSLPSYLFFIFLSLSPFILFLFFF